MDSTSKQICGGFIRQDCGHTDLLGSGKKIAALWAAFDQLSHDDPALAKVVLSVLVVVEAREKGKRSRDSLCMAQGRDGMDYPG